MHCRVEFIINDTSSKLLKSKSLLSQCKMDSQWAQAHQSSWMKPLKIFHLNFHEKESSY